MFKNIVLFKDLGILLTKSQKNILLFILATTISFMWANYSTYYISNIEVYMMMFSVLLLLTKGKGMMDYNETKKVRPLFLASFVIYFFITLIIHGEKFSVSVLCCLLLGYCVLSLKPKFKIWIYDRFISVLALLFGLSALEYLLAVFWGISYINHTPIYRFESNEHYFYQGIITVFPYLYKTSLVRFQAFTEEPGLVGTLCAFLLACIDIKRHKWQLAVFVVCGILSMSLAFYLIFVLWIGYMMFNVKNIKYNIILFVFIAIICFLAQDEITELVMGRLAEKGNISDLDNRGTYSFKTAFDEFIVSSDAVFGRGLRTYHSTFSGVSKESGGNAGAKPFIYSYGLFSMLLLFFSYSKCFLKVNGSNIKAFFILFIFWLSFYQREYWYTPYNMIPLFMYGLYDQYMKSLKIIK